MTQNQLIEPKYFPCNYNSVKSTLANKNIHLAPKVAFLSNVITLVLHLKIANTKEPTILVNNIQQNALFKGEVMENVL